MPPPIPPMPPPMPGIPFIIPPPGPPIPFIIPPPMPGIPPHAAAHACWSRTSHGLAGHSRGGLDDPVTGPAQHAIGADAA